jgi:uncharacterized membrane protein YecN with MAPEG domain
MEMPNVNVLSVVPLYIALFALVFVPITLRAGLFRLKSNILIGDGGDPEMLRRIRGQGNFVETVPLALLLLVMMEVLGASDTWLHALCATLLVGRILHYIGLTEIGPGICRPVGMFATLGVYLVGSGWVLVDLLG